MSTGRKKLGCGILALAMLLTLCGSSVFANSWYPTLQFQEGSYSATPYGDLYASTLVASDDDATPLPGFEVYYTLRDCDGYEEFIGVSDSGDDGVSYCYLNVGESFPYTLIAETGGEEAYAEVEITEYVETPEEEQPEEQPAAETTKATPTAAPHLAFGMESYKTSTEFAVLDGYLTSDTDGKQGIANATIDWTAKDSKGKEQSGSVTTDEKGAFGVSIDTEKGMTYTVSVSFKGNETFTSANATTSLYNAQKKAGAKVVTVLLIIVIVAVIAAVVMLFIVRSQRKKQEALRKAKRAQRMRELEEEREKIEL